MCAILAFVAFAFTGEVVASPARVAVADVAVGACVLAGTMICITRIRVAIVNIDTSETVARPAREAATHVRARNVNAAGILVAVVSF
jgi:hypothetical protein